ncbi:hypothetical protein GE09DRAFT_1062188 [Coniochaeta sp. 2T2.1]|nr:hypothetical protein GE09DRAFT_1062188 [Coniochaeta sp. 2T2.1]
MPIFIGFADSGRDSTSHPGNARFCLTICTSGGAWIHNEQHEIQRQLRRVVNPNRADTPGSEKGILFAEPKYGRKIPWLRLMLGTTYLDPSVSCCPVLLNVDRPPPG